MATGEGMQDVYRRLIELERRRLGECGPGCARRLEAEASIRYYQGRMRELLGAGRN